MWKESFLNRGRSKWQGQNVLGMFKNSKETAFRSRISETV